VCVPLCLFRLLRRCTGELCRLPGISYDAPAALAAAALSSSDNERLLKKALSAAPAFSLYSPSPSLAAAAAAVAAAASSEVSLKTKAVAAVAACCFLSVAAGLASHYTYVQACEKERGRTWERGLDSESHTHGAPITHTHIHS